MEQRWKFLSRWCSALVNRVRYKKVEAENHVWTAHKFRLEVDLPKRYELSRYRQGFALNEDDEAEFRGQMQQVREALALLAAVAQVDHDAWKFLLREKCYVKMGKPGEEKYEKDVLVKFLLKADLKENKKTKDDESIGLDLLLFFDTCHRTEPSAAYVRALAKIAKMDDQQRAGKAGVDVKIPVQVFFSESNDKKTAAERLQNVGKAEKSILETWKPLEKESVKAKTLMCTFVLQPMVAIFDYGGIDIKVVKTIEALLADKLRFSYVEVYPSVSDSAGMKKLTHLMTSLFGGLSPPGDEASSPYACDSDEGRNEYQLGSVNLQCENNTRSWEFGAAMSSLLLNGATSHVNLALTSIDDDVARKKWMWLAYGVFSKRARALESLTINDVDRMSVEDVEGFAAVLATDHPEEVLCGYSHGCVAERSATLAKGAKVRWERDDEGQIRTKSRTLAFPLEMDGVWTFSDDGESELVNVIVPGFGHCLAQRADLVFHEAPEAATTEHAPSSLTILFNKDPNDSDEAETEGSEGDDSTAGLSLFLETIGLSLTQLTLDGPRADIDENLILRSCPKLEKLSLCGGLVDVQIDFSEYRARFQAIPTLTCNWHDVESFATALSDPANPLAKCVYRLRVRLKTEWNGWMIEEDTHNPPDFKANADKLLEMLDKNKSVGYLEVVAPIEHKVYAERFSKFHLKPIKRSTSSFLESIAFLSVISSQRESGRATKKPKLTVSGHGHALSELNQHVLSNIFEFAAEFDLRQVYFHSQHGYDWDSEDEDLFARL